MGEGDPLATLYAADEARLDEGEHILLDAYDIQDREPEPVPHFYARVSRDGVERLG